MQQDVWFYYMRGWILIPLNGKVPPKGFQLKEVFAKNAQEPVEVEKYFPSSYQGNVGIITGKASSLVVVDLDSPAHVPWVVERFGNTPFIVQTGKQGFHFYYRYPDGETSIGNRVRLWGRQIDLRADGGYVVGPPSIHPQTGKAYQWHRPLEQMSLDDMLEFDPSLLPKPKASNTPSRTEFPQNRKNNIERARRYLGTIRCVSGSAAHNTLFRACCKLIELFDLNENEMRHLLNEWSQTNCFDQNQQSYPWSEKELDHKIYDSFRIVNSSKPKGTKPC
jgi:bifunctional DNA primase/polymerase-like protein